MKKLSIVSLIIISLNLFLSGCLSVRSNHAEIQTAAKGIENKEKTKVQYQIHVHANTDLARKGKLAKEEYHQLLKLTEESDCCIVVSENTPSDLKVDLHINHRRASIGVFPLILSIASLYTIPTWQTYNVEYEMTITDSSGRVRSRSFNDSYKIYRWLPLIVAAPFFDTRSEVIDSIINDQNKMVLSNLEL